MQTFQVFHSPCNCLGVKFPAMAEVDGGNLSSALLDALSSLDMKT